MTAGRRAERGDASTGERVDRGRLERVLGEAHHWLQEHAPRGPVRLVGRVRLMVMLCSDYLAGRYTRVPVATIWMLVFALLYVVGPLDIVPDIIPGFGWIDDAFVVALVFKAVRRDLRRYCDATGLERQAYGL